MPEVEGRGCLCNDHRKVTGGIFWILRSGAPWRDVPERYGGWQTVYDRFRRWASGGTLESDRWHLQGGLDAEGSVDWSQLDSCSTIVQAAQAAAGGPSGVKKGSNQARRRRRPGTRL